ncbi:hypothetical protein J6590_053372 [Homalodisca vitripennis]|nr:hypothetical protein J6590_053372 [Homalodisca vitripennis]
MISVLQILPEPMVGKSMDMDFIQQPSIGYSGYLCVFVHALAPEIPYTRGRVQNCMDYNSFSCLSFPMRLSSFGYDHEFKKTGQVGVFWSTECVHWPAHLSVARLTPLRSDLTSLLLRPKQSDSSQPRQYHAVGQVGVFWSTECVHWPAHLSVARLTPLRSDLTSLLLRPKQSDSSQPRQYHAV